MPNTSRNLSEIDKFKFSSRQISTLNENLTKIAVTGSSGTQILSQDRRDVASCHTGI